MVSVVVGVHGGLLIASSVQGCWSRSVWVIYGIGLRGGVRDLGRGVCDFGREVRDFGCGVCDLGRGVCHFGRGVRDLRWVDDVGCGVGSGVDCAAGVGSGRVCFTYGAWRDGPYGGWRCWWLLCVAAVRMRLTHDAGVAGAICDVVICRLVNWGINAMADEAIAM